MGSGSNVAHPELLRLWFSWELIHMQGGGNVRKGKKFHERVAGMGGGSGRARKETTPLLTEIQFHRKKKEPEKRP